MVQKEECQTFSEIMMLMLSYSISEYTDKEDSDLPLLFKDPKEDQTIDLNFISDFIILKYHSISCFCNPDQDVKEPVRIIISPPPQIS